MMFGFHWYYVYMCYVIAGLIFNNITSYYFYNILTLKDFAKNILTSLIYGPFLDMIAVIIIMICDSNKIVLIKPIVGRELKHKK